MRVSPWLERPLSVTWLTLICPVAYYSAPPRHEFSGPCSFGVTIAKQPTACLATSRDPRAHIMRRQNTARSQAMSCTDTVCTRLFSCVSLKRLNRGTPRMTTTIAPFINQPPAISTNQKEARAQLVLASHWPGPLRHPSNRPPPVRSRRLQQLHHWLVMCPSSRTLQRPPPHAGTLIDIGA